MKWKTDTNTVKNCKFSTAAGICIGFGVIINLISENPIIGSLFFGFGLLTIIALKLSLYTGKIGFLKNPIDYPLMLLSNMLGVLIITIIYMLAKPEFINIIKTASILKFQKNYLQILCLSLLCGMLIHFAVKTKETITVLLAVSIFILIGAEHCIADFPYLIANFNLENCIKWVTIVIGNSLGAIFIERLTGGEN